MHKPEIHRVVTGHDENGKAIVSIDGGLSAVTEISTLPGVFFHEVWNTQGSPAVIDNGPDPHIDRHSNTASQTGIAHSFRRYTTGEQGKSPTRRRPYA